MQDALPLLAPIPSYLFPIFYAEPGRSGRHSTITRPQTKGKSGNSGSKAAIRGTVDGQAGNHRGQGQGMVESTGAVMVARNGGGNFTKHYYRFTNVRITQDAMQFYMPAGDREGGQGRVCEPRHATHCMPDVATLDSGNVTALLRCWIFSSASVSPPHSTAGMDRPQEHWVDFISSNGTHPTLPTTLVIKGDKHASKWYYMPIEYLEAGAAHAPACKGWLEKPTYLLQVRYR
jgi:hypothetical protein